MVDIDESIVLTPSGDLIITNKTHDASTTFLVSSGAMCLASSVWRAMLEGDFKEADTSKGKREIHFADDDPVALLMLLRVGHMQFKELSRTY